MLYLGDKGIPQNYPEAMKWFRKAADQGLAKSQFQLGLMYEQGLGVPQDQAEAAKWYQKAADQGFADAKAKLEAGKAKAQ